MSIRATDQPDKRLDNSRDTANQKLPMNWQDEVREGFNLLSAKIKRANRSSVEDTLARLSGEDQLTFKQQELPNLQKTYLNGLRITKDRKDHSYGLVLPGDDSKILRIDSEGLIRKERNPDLTHQADDKAAAPVAMHGMAKVDKKGNLFLNLAPDKSHRGYAEQIKIETDGSVSVVSEFDGEIEYESLYPAHGNWTRESSTDYDGSQQTTNLTLLNPKPGQKETTSDGTLVTLDGKSIRAERINFDKKKGTLGIPEEATLGKPERATKVWTRDSSGITLDRDGRHLQISDDANLTSPDGDFIYQDNQDHCRRRPPNLYPGATIPEGMLYLGFKERNGSKLTISTWSKGDNILKASIDHTVKLDNSFKTQQEFVSAVIKQIKEAGIDSLTNVIKRGSNSGFWTADQAQDDPIQQINNGSKDIQLTETSDGWKFIQLNTQGMPKQSVDYNLDGVKFCANKFCPSGSILETTEFTDGKIAKKVQYFPDSDRVQMKSLYFADKKNAVSEQTIYTKDSRAITYAYMLDGSKTSEMNWSSGILTVYGPDKDSKTFVGKQLNEMLDEYRRQNNRGKTYVENQFKMNYNRFLRVMEATFGTGRSDI